MIETALMLSLLFNVGILAFAMGERRLKHDLLDLVSEQKKAIQEQKQYIDWYKTLPRDSQGKLK